MGRGIDRTAGYKLLEELRKAGIQSQAQAEANRRGALNASNRPDELFQLVLSAIGSRN